MQYCLQPFSINAKMSISGLEMKIDRAHNPAMSEDTTRDLPSRSFEERVFGRFDSLDRNLVSFNARLDARFDSLEGRIEALESQAERRALETKPIWERALAELGEVKLELGEVKGELGEVKDRLGAVEGRLGALEDLTRPLLRKVDTLTKDVMTVRSEQLGLEDRLEKLDPGNI
jgi:chromosome segregation ATPase